MGGTKRSAADGTGEDLESTAKKRPASLVSRLRNDAKFSDADICAAGKTFPIHRDIVCGLSHFFMKAFTGAFKEAGKRSLVIKDASSQAMSVVIDYAYCQDVKTAMNKNFELTGEVISLSHRFEISELTDVVLTVASSQVAIDNSIRLYRMFSLYNCSQKRDVFLFVVRRLKKRFPALLTSRKFRLRI